jgi:hypothetical protein
VCIDAGYEEDYFTAFDGGYHNRIWDGDGNGTSEIDIGVFEYGAPAFGGIEGYTYDQETDEILRFTFVNEMDEIINFDISDNNGYYKITLADGVYNLQCSFPFYQDVLMSGITVNNGEYTYLDIYLAPDGYVDNDEEEIVMENGKLKMENYPNPFNPETTIYFSTTESTENAELIIYNIKGQCVRRLKMIDERLKMNLVGWDLTDGNGHNVSSGVYFVRMKAGGEYKAQRKVVVVR